MLLLASVMSKMMDNKTYTFGVRTIYNMEKEKLEKRRKRNQEMELEEKEVFSNQELIKKNDEELKKKLEKEIDFFDFR